MRTSIGTTWFLQLMILFILIFAAYIILTLQYSRTIKLKNEAVSMIEKYEGITDTSLKLVNDYLKRYDYKTTGMCTNTGEAGVYGASDLGTYTLEPAEANKEYYYCIKKYKGANVTHYYQIILFYEFKLPVIGNTGAFNVRGVTSNFVTHDKADYCTSIGGTCYS